MSYVNRINSVLSKALSQVEADGWLTEAVGKKEVFLRPPKDETRGDLATNAAMVVAAKSGRDLAQVANFFLEKFHASDAVFAATQTRSGYINLKISPDFLARELARILTDCDSLSASKAVLAADCTIPIPDDISDLISARVKLNSECLVRIADQYGVSCKTEPWINDADNGFSYETAIAKCSKNMLHMFLLAYPNALAHEFSPLKVVDRSYGNPGFAIPYAYAQTSRAIYRCLEGADIIPLEKLAAATKISLFTDLHEKRLIKQISQWHAVVEKVFLSKSVEGLVGYLLQTSGLYFELSSSLRIVSSDYLKSADDKPARLGLITATSMILAKGLELLGFEVKTEVR